MLTWHKAAIGGALAAATLFAAGTVYVERERRDAAAQERARIADEARRDRLEHIDAERGRRNEIDQLGSDDLRGRFDDWMRP